MSRALLGSLLLASIAGAGLTMWKENVELFISSESGAQAVVVTHHGLHMQGRVERAGKWQPRPFARDTGQRSDTLALPAYVTAFGIGAADVVAIGGARIDARLRGLFGSATAEQSVTDSHIQLRQAAGTDNYVLVGAASSAR